MPEEEKSKKLKDYLKKIMKEKFPNLVKEIDIPVQEEQRIPNNMDTNYTTPRDNAKG